MGVGLQAFSWDDLSDRASHFASLAGRAEELADAGFTHVWTPPPSKSADVYGYIPEQWYTIEGASFLRSFTRALSDRGVTPVCDIVINHRGGTAKDSCDGDYIAFTKPDWGPWGVVANDTKCDGGAFCEGSCGCGSADTGENFCGSPDVDHTNPQVQSDVVAWLKWLKSEYRFAGWRFDFVRGYAPSYVKQYVDAAGENWAVGEYYDPEAGNIGGWASTTGLHAFDFPQRNALRDAIRAGDFSQLKWDHSPPGLAGAMGTSAVTLLDNHDTARPTGEAIGDGGFGNDYEVMLGHAYILTHPAFPFVFLQHLDSTNGADIKKLMKIRNAARISPADSLYISAASPGVYAAFIGAGRECAGKLAMKVGPDAWSPCGSGWSLAGSGRDWAVWKAAGDEEILV